MQRFLTPIHKAIRLFGDIGDSIKLGAFLVVGATAVIFGLLSVWHQITELPAIYQTTLGTGTALLLTACTWGSYKALQWWHVGRHIERAEPAAQCSERHLTPDEQSWLGVLNTFRMYDRENINGYLDVHTEIELDTIYSKTFPFVTIVLCIYTSAVHRVELGNVIKGTITDGTHVVGDTPKLLVNDDGSDRIIGLSRGERGSITLQQVITPELRERWIKNYLGKEIRFDFSQLFIAADVLDPRNNAQVTQDRLQIDKSVSSVLQKTVDWPWDEYQ